MYPGNHHNAIAMSNTNYHNYHDDHNQLRNHDPSDLHYQYLLHLPMQYGSPKRIRQLSSVVDDDNGAFGRYYSHSCIDHCSRNYDHAVEDRHSTLAYLDSFPVGYRFYPTDQELISEYLSKKIKNDNVPKSKIGDIDIYGNHPAMIVENQPAAREGQWYFFSPRTRKYANGTRPDRKAGNGYWKATGADNKIFDDNGVEIGAKKSLVYYDGNPPNGTKSDWIMQEYVVTGHQRQRIDQQDMKLDDYVLCKIYKRDAGGRNTKKKQVVTSNDAEENPRTSVTNVVMVHDSNPAILPIKNVPKKIKIQVPIPNEQLHVASIQRPTNATQVIGPNHIANPQNSQPNNNPMAQNSSSCCYTGTGLEMMVPQPFLPPSSCFNAMLQFNWTGPSINLGPPMIPQPTYESANGGGIDLLELGYFDDYLSVSTDHDLDLNKLEHLNTSESKTQVSAPKNGTNLG